MSKQSLDDILPCNCGMNDILNGKHYDDCPKSFKQAIVEAVEGLIGPNENSEGNKPHGDVRNQLRDELMQAIKEWQ